MVATYFCVAFLAFSLLSVQALPSCSVSTVVKTVTVSSPAATQSSNAVNLNNKNGNNNNNNNNKNNNADPQKSLTLDPRVIGAGFANNGQDVPTAGQVASLTTTNNFINFCLTSTLPITNGKQVTTGSCNPIPQGLIPAANNMPSCKFTNPKNLQTIKAGTTFNVEMAIQKMQTGFFVNAQANYFAAPQQLNGAGQIQGHSHVVIEKLSAIDQTTPTDPQSFVFFKGLNAAAQGGKLTTSVDNGLQPGVYKLSSINTSSNHQPLVVPVAQHGSLDDAVYFTVTADGNPPQPQASNTPQAGNTPKTGTQQKGGNQSKNGK